MDRSFAAFPVASDTCIGTALRAVGLLACFVVAISESVAQSAAQSGLDEFKAGKTNMFTTLEPDKPGIGITLRLSYPASWTLKEAAQPDKKGDTAVTFSNADGQIMIVAVDKNKETLDRKSADKEISKTLRAMKIGLALAPGVKREASGTTTVSGQPGFYLEMTARDKEKKQYTHMVMETIMCPSNTVAMILTVSSALDHPKDADAKFGVYKVVFDEIVKSMWISEP